ncbi:hypothetical protein FB567DRAFT_288070 [Paraphoma chrysanthemicola]|uniref:Uncharacterized protein n=1 Tax=Paraphoma chrysanthemicola TaxID=798071 RepID=A0A8K0RA77_9PLEO|nr:hypothetical protein FB567DRAFT_288070 [Paraphoma chrysanthemicola]
MKALSMATCSSPAISASSFTSHLRFPPPFDFLNSFSVNNCKYSVISSSIPSSRPSSISSFNFFSISILEFSLSPAPLIPNLVRSSLALLSCSSILIAASQSFSACSYVSRLTASYAHGGHMPWILYFRRCVTCAHETSCPFACSAPEQKSGGMPGSGYLWLHARKRE